MKIRKHGNLVDKEMAVDEATSIIIRERQNHKEENPNFIKKFIFDNFYRN